MVEAVQKVLILAGLASAGCMALELDSAYVGGPNSRLANDEREEVGQLILNGQIRGCTATVVGDRTVLTAAHCVDYRTGTLKTYRFELYELGSNVITEWPTRQYSSSTTNSWSLVSSRAELYATLLGTGSFRDIAIVRLKEPVPQHIPRAMLSTTAPDEGTELTIYGFGGTFTSDGRDCIGGSHKTAGDRTDPGNPRGLSLSSDGITTCPGDSGGPVFREDTGEIAYITAARHLVAPESLGATPVDLHSEWLEDRMKSSEFDINSL